MSTASYGEGEQGETLLSSLSVLYRFALQNIYEKHADITKSQFLIIVALYKNASLTMSEVAEYISSSREQATRALSPLAEKGLVERYTDPSCRKHVRVRLTSDGRETIRRHIAISEEKVHQRLSESLNEEEMTDLRLAFQTIIRLLGKIK